MAFFLLMPVTSLVVVWILYYAYCLLTNYSEACRIGLPVIVIPITPENHLWMGIQSAFGPILRQLPFNATSFTRHTRMGWEFHDRYATHQRLGDAWILVTPTRNWLFVANPDTITNIFGRGRDFINPAWMLEPLSVFGPNISVAEGPDWQRQRKLTATPFNENKNPLVWGEAARQTKQMMTHWRSISSQGSVHTADDARTLALNVLAFVAFEKSYPFQSFRSDLVLDDHRPMTYRESIATILNNALVVLVVPRPVFSLSFLPRSLRQVGKAIAFFRLYMLDEIHRERDLVKAGQRGSGSLVSNLVRAGLDEDEKDSRGEHEGSKLKPLSEEEILGNIFVFNFAGHDTTAISLSYALLLLVAHRDVQDWLHEEVTYYASKHHKPEDLDYKLLYPNLKRCLAVLLETLRLYNPLPGVPKYTGKRAATLTINGQNYNIPANTMVVPSLQASHTHPRHWSSDSLVWRPQRWILNSATTTTKSGTNRSISNDGGRLEDETLLVPPKGVFFAWSEGVRNCPGKKFAQVEFVAVIATLCRDMVGEPVPGPDEDEEQARRRVLDTVRDSDVELLLQMRNPQSVAVRWTDRKPDAKS